MQDVIFASNNKGKIREVQSMLQGYHVYSLRDIGFNQDIEEYGETFAVNALIKVEAIRKQFSSKIIIADDSGLCVDHLLGEPGVKSKRFSGEGTTEEDRNNIIIDYLKGVEDTAKRTAFMISVYAIYLPNGNIMIVDGKMHGQIAFAPTGENGFAYDRIFYLPEYGKTVAQLSLEQKNKISHRSKALIKVKAEIKRYEEMSGENGHG